MPVKGKQDPTLRPIGHPQAKLPAPQTLSLTPQAQHFLSADQHFALDIAAGTVSSAQIQAAGGKIQLQVVQTDASGGGSASGELLFGTYQLNLLDAQGQPLPLCAWPSPLDQLSSCSKSGQPPAAESGRLRFLGERPSLACCISTGNTHHRKTTERQPTTVDCPTIHMRFRLRSEEMA